MTQTAEIAYGGISTSPDYKQSKDGDAALLVNMECTPYGLRPSQVCDTPVIEKENFTALYLHRIPESEDCHIIGLLVQGDGSILHAFKCSDVSASVPILGANPVRQADELSNWSCVGNVVSFTDKGRLKYLFYNNGQYRVLPALPPYLPIEFACKRVLGNFENPNTSGGLPVSNRNPDEYHATMIGGLPNKIASVDIFITHDTQEGNKYDFDPYYVPEQSRFTEANLRADDVVFGVLNSGISTALGRGELMFPRIIRYALRLTTGEQHLQYSPPILLFPREDSVSIEGTGDSTGKFMWKDQGETLKTGLRIWCECWKPQMRFMDGTGIAALQALKTTYKDLVAGVDIYLSAPIYTMSFEHVLCKKHYNNSDGSSYTKPYFAKTRNFDKIPDISEMYLLRHIPLESIDSLVSLNWSDVIGKEDIYKLKTIQNQPVMPLNSYGNRVLSAGVIYAANSRFVLGDVSESLPKPFSFKQMSPPVLSVSGTAHDQSASNHPEELSQSGLYKQLPFSLTYNPEVTAVKTACKVSGSHSGGGSYTTEAIEKNGWVWFPIYYTYPDRLATLLHTRSDFPPEEQDYWKYPLKPSSWDNMSYTFAKKDDHNIGSTSSNSKEWDAQTPHGTSRRHPNTLKMSDAGSPLYFHDGNSLQVGSGRITAIASNSLEVSQGMYGQYNLIAFATDGISVVTLTGDGSLDSPVSIGTEIVAGMKHVGQMDTIVIAVADTGVIAVAGSEIKHLLSYFPDMDMSWKENRHLSKVLEKQYPSLPDIAPLRDYFKEAQPIYDSQHDRVLVFNPRLGYSYVWNTQSKQWSVLTIRIDRRIPMPGRCLVSSGNALYDLSKDGNSLQGLYISRALKIDHAETAKRLVRVTQRGTAVDKRTFSGKVLLYSNARSDLTDTPVASGEGYKLHSYGLPWPGQLHRLVVFVPTWSRMDCILSGCTLLYQNYLNRNYP